MRPVKKITDLLRAKASEREKPEASIVEKVDAFEEWIRSGKAGILFVSKDSGLELPVDDDEPKELLGPVPELPDNWTVEKEQVFREWVRRGMRGILVDSSRGGPSAADVDEKLWRHVFNMFLEIEQSDPGLSRQRRDDLPR